MLAGLVANGPTLKRGHETYWGADSRDGPNPYDFLAKSKGRGPMLVNSKARSDALIQGRKKNTLRSIGLGAPPPPRSLISSRLARSRDFCV